MYILSLICIVVIAGDKHIVKMFIYSSIDYVLNSNLSIIMSS